MFMFACSIWIFLGQVEIIKIARSMFSSQFECADSKSVLSLSLGCVEVEMLHAQDASFCHYRVAKKNLFFK